MSFQYRGLKGQLDKHVVTLEEVDRRLEAMRDQNPRYDIIYDRPTQNGDEVVLDYAGYCDGIQFAGGTAEMQTLVLGSHTFIPGFEEQLVGHNIDDEVTVHVTFPQQYHAPDLAGKDAEFRCKIHQIRVKSAYEMDDVFAKEVGGCETFEEFHKLYWQDLQQYADNRCEMELQEELLRSAAKTLDFEPDEARVEQEVSAQMENLKAQLAQRGLSLEMYCHFQGTTQEKLEKDMHGNAVMSLKMQEATARIAQLEHLAVTQEERDTAVTVICRQNHMGLEDLKPYMDEEFYAAVDRSVMMGKVMRLIRDAAKVTPMED